MNMRTLQRRHDQSGLVSIIVVTVIIVILSLVTIGFTKIMSRELSQSLDRELASQANYGRKCFGALWRPCEYG
jgi:Tfp pilus assembly protein PilX